MKTAQDEPEPSAPTALKQPETPVSYKDTKPKSAPVAASTPVKREAPSIVVAPASTEAPLELPKAESVSKSVPDSHTRSSSNATEYEIDRIFDDINKPSPGIPSIPSSSAASPLAVHREHPHTARAKSPLPRAESPIIEVTASVQEHFDAELIVPKCEPNDKTDAFETVSPVEVPISLDVSSHSSFVLVAPADDCKVAPTEDESKDWDAEVASAHISQGAWTDNCVTYRTYKHRILDAPAVTEAERTAVATKSNEFVNLDATLDYIQQLFVAARATTGATGTERPLGKLEDVISQCHTFLCFCVIFHVTETDSSTR